MTAPDESLWGSATDKAKAEQRRYLQDLLRDDPDRDALIKAREWCLNEWDQLRQEYFPDSACDRPLRAPFIEFTAQAGNTEEPARYQLIGSQGQPSTIDIRRNFLLATSDLTIAKWADGERRLILKKDHPQRWNYIRGLLLHELLHQWLVEAAPERIRTEYAQRSTRGKAENGGEMKQYKGHGNWFCLHANEIEKRRAADVGYIFNPYRIAKTANAPADQRKWIPCTWFGTLDRFFAWDPDAEGLTPAQLKENDLQMQQGLKEFDGAVELVKTEKPVLTFKAPFSEECFDTCLEELRGYDGENGTQLVDAFATRCVSALHSAGSLEKVLDHVGYRRAEREIRKPARADVESIITCNGYSPEPKQLDIPTRGDVPEWLAYSREVAAAIREGCELDRRSLISYVIDTYFDGQEPPRKRPSFNSLLGEVCGCTGERIRQLVKEHLNTSQAAIAA